MFDLVIENNNKNNKNNNMTAWKQKTLLRI